MANTVFRVLGHYSLTNLKVVPASEEQKNKQVFVLLFEELTPPGHKYFSIHEWSALYTDIKRPLPSRGQLKVDLALCGRCCVGAVNRKHVANKQANVRFFSALPSSGFAVVCLCTGQTRGLRTISVRYFREAVPKNHKLSDEEGKLLAYYVQLRDALNTATHVEDEPAEKSASRTQGL